ncbi:MAG: hypothetical protein WKF30_05310 [Pyrinomonadaceae bacterium]
MAEDDNDEQLGITADIDADDIDADDQGAGDGVTGGVGGDAAGASIIDVTDDAIAGSDTGDEGRGGLAIGRATGVTTGTSTKGASSSSSKKSSLSSKAAQQKEAPRRRRHRCGKEGRRQGRSVQNCQQGSF